LKDSYLKECVAKAVEANGKEIVFDRTVFYPVGGGLPCDSGKIECGGKNFVVNEVRKKEGKIVHVLSEEGISVGEECIMKIDWSKRYAVMRMHTAAHVLGGTMFEHGALITGNQIGAEESRIDFSLEEFDRQKLDGVVAEANEKLAKNAEVKIYELPREEAFKIPGIVKLAAVLPPSIPVLRIVEIGDIDIQADGGVHVKNTRECGAIATTKFENKGAKNRRIYFKLF
jgi:misacylated tRNA(Ala) deacylase